MPAPETAPADARARDAGEVFDVLSYFHFALAAMIAMAALVPPIYLAVGRALAPAGEELVRTEGARAADSFVLVAVAVLVFAAFLLAALVGWGARCLQKRERWSLCVAASALACLFFPLGTLLGGFTLQRLLDPRQRARFGS
ncbi:MAG: hypothetical protein F9K18_12905 [Thermoanaerobaculia bacterium]|nr:MAG: hypothetical protein F9K18_12905 [Thermoanaerobaculia bacterium]